MVQTGGGNWKWNLLLQVLIDGREYCLNSAGVRHTHDLNLTVNGVYRVLGVCSHYTVDIMIYDV